MSFNDQRRDSYDSEEPEEDSSSSTASSNISKDMLSSQSSKQEHKIRILPWVSIGNLFFLILSVVLFCSGSTQNMYKTSKNKLLKESSFYSPIFDRLEISMSPVKMNATLWGQDPPSIYRGKPGPEVDAAWKRLTAEHAIPISADEVKKLGKDPKTAVKFPESFGYGSDAYVAQVDVFHQIHCLDALRKEMHRNYYSGLPSSSRNTMQKIHINHCVHVLLQNLLCESSVDLITYNWMEGLHFPFPDFDLTHQCRNFETLLDWQHEHMVDGRLYETIFKTDDVVPLRPPRQLIYDIFSLNKGIFKPI